MSNRAKAIIAIVGLIVAIIAMVFGGIQVYENWPALRQMSANSTPVATTPQTTGVPSPIDTPVIPTDTPTLLPDTPVVPTNTPTPQSGPTPTLGPYHNGDYAEWFANSSPQTVSPGQYFQIYFTLGNAGSTTWTSPQYTLQCDNFYHTQPYMQCMGGAVKDLPVTELQPGQIVTFTVVLTAPSQPGYYETWWDMRDNNGIFPNNNMYVVVNVS